MKRSVRGDGEINRNGSRETAWRGQLGRVGAVESGRPLEGEGE